MTTAYALILDANDYGIGAHKWEDSTTMVLAPNEVECTEAQAQNPMAYCVVNGVIVESLTAAQATQSTLITAGCAKADATPISFTDSAGITDTYQTDPDSMTHINNALAAFRASGVVPSGFYWRSATNANNPFTYADLVNLASAIGVRAFANFAQKQSLKAQIVKATSVSAVQEVVWVNP